jgi:hypothetical protein
MTFNGYGVWAIYKFEMARAIRTLWQSIVTPVITTALYFVVFGSAIGSRMTEIDGVPYGAFIVPGLIMLSLFTQSIFNASFGIYFPKFTGTIYELLSAPVSPFAARAVADDHPLQPGGLSDLRLPLELLRPGRRAHRLEPGRHLRLPPGLPRGDRLDVQDGLSSEDLTRLSLDDMIVRR